MKKQDGYELNISGTHKKVKYTFTSVGSKGSIKKIIEFSPMKGNKRWNLGFGDVKGRTWEDNVITNNNDLRKVLQTVANTVHLFLHTYPDREVVIIPVDYQRKLLYNRAFQQRWHEIDSDYTVKGIILDIEDPQFENYETQKIYDYFIIKLRK
jgi:hypothetical protein